MDSGPNISPVEIIKKGAFGGTYFRNIYSGVNDTFYKNSWYFRQWYFKQWYFRYWKGRRIKDILVDGKELLVDLKIF